MTTTKNTAKKIRETINARKAAANQRRIARINRQEWIDREAKNEAR